MEMKQLEIYAQHPMCYCQKFLISESCISIKMCLDVHICPLIIFLTRNRNITEK